MKHLFKGMVALVSLMSLVACGRAATTSTLDGGAIATEALKPTSMVNAPLVTRTAAVI